jgi:site-specific DNA-methyltransferase (adenine-specific)
MAVSAALAGSVQGRARRLRAFHGADEWATPLSLFTALHEEFGFTLDVCALPENTKCERFYTPEQDGLQQPWEGVCWMNPPYRQKVIGAWVKKAWESSQSGSLVVGLLPARTDTQWWHQWAMRASEIRFVRGRLTFDAPSGFRPGGHNCPFPSAIVIFRPGKLP